MIEQFGDPSGMVATDVPAPNPGPGQLVIETEAMGVGGVDGVTLGSSAMELAARGGASAVAVTTSSSPRGSRLRDLGASHVLNRSGSGDPDAPHPMT